MDPISNTDRLVMLLRQKLQERTRATAAGGTASKQQESVPVTPEATGLEALASMNGVDDRAFRRAVIHSLLADQLGMDLINEAQFQNIVSRVTDAIESDDEASLVLGDVVTELRKR